MRRAPLRHVGRTAAMTTGAIGAEDGSDEETGNWQDHRVFSERAAIGATAGP